MTRSPLLEAGVKGMDGPKYALPVRCVNPFCSRRVNPDQLEPHHMFRRTALGGAFDWVKLPDGTIVANVVPLCHWHHREVTIHKADIAYFDGQFIWKTDTRAAPLNPQPIRSMREDARIATPHVHGSPAEGEECPTCHRKVPVKKPKLEGERKRQVLSIRAPADGEDGVEIIDSLIQECARIFGRPTTNEETGKEIKGWRYYVLVEALALVVQNEALLVRDEPDVPEPDPGQTTIEEQLEGLA